MKLLHRPSVGLVGRIFAILLVAVLIEFGASTFFYERASQYSVRDDEARRLAEHLIIARKLLSEHPERERPALAMDLTTSRYDIGWRRDAPPRLPAATTLDRIHEQVIAWEPSLKQSDLQLRLTGSPREPVVVGGLVLSDGSWMRFGTRVPLHALGFSWERILMALVPAVALILISGLLLRQMLLPLRRLAAAAEKVGGGAIEEVPQGGPGDVRNVIDAFNRMQSRIHRLIADRTQALAAVGHDMRTPLARLRLRADAVDDDAAREAIEGDISEMEAMIGSLLAYLGGEGDDEKRVRVDLAVLCETIVDDVEDRGREAHYAGPEHCEVSLRPIGFKRALVNLVENALHYGDRVWVTLEERPHGVAVRVEDDGPGIPEESLKTVLQPFVRLDRARARDTMGLGLGLSIVVRAIKAEGGTLELANRSAGGLSATLILPHSSD